MASTQDTGKFRENTLDKFYTRPDVAASIVATLLDRMPALREWQWIEPSAGGGAFLAALPANIRARAIAIDLVPAAPGILQGNFLEWTPPPATQPRILFGNPPFGRQGSLAKKFIATAASMADAIAFILPRSFLKPSMSRAFPPNFHLVWSSELDPASFLVNGESYAVPTVAQLWVKQETPRTVAADASPEGFAYVASTDPYTLSIRRVGVNAGHAFSAEKQVSRQSHYFVRLAEPTRRNEVIAGLMAHQFPSNTTGPRSLSKGEVTAVLNALLAGEP